MTMKLKKILNIFTALTQLLLILLIILTLAVTFLSRRGISNLRAFVISTGSMGTSIPAGSLIITQPQDSYQKDDIITYYTNDSNGNRQKLPTTHRLVEVKQGENLGYQTKGDGNQTVDPFITPAKSLIGKVIFHLPFFGYFSNFAQSRNGFIFLIVIPATILIYGEINTIFKEINKLIKKKKVGATLAVARKKHLSSRGSANWRRRGDPVGIATSSDKSESSQ
ncbi:signal peptidase I [Patescibacteria group bacterium]|nr:signal peptidase I [Patescibacteria group bacterium]MBU4389731.1 signal peptidase I [Patescibacteria group bacterium]MBU4431243.1 signal peptidase I [Patescibacteria group bacterium]MBU4578840.1 signal peptidase I [Patescibacteria group bacterium]MCG2702369.1 signal peptidase I [Candidatus Parcubacteria bacterium]